MKRITIKDLAKMLSVSTSTVSRALSNHPDISDETKERVKSLARQFNYTTNVHARFFRKQHSRLIALILPEVNMFFTPKLIRGVNQAISSTKYSLITFLSNDSLKKEKEIVNQCLSWAVEGVLISVSKETSNLDHLNPLLETNVKCVLLDKVLNSNKYSSVTINSKEASYNAVMYLLNKGHRNILGVFGNTNFIISQERIAGYENAFRDAGIEINTESIVSVEKCKDLDNIMPILLKYQQFTAIFVMSDELLMRVMYHLAQFNLKIPNDISIISISDGVYPTLVYPQIDHIKDSGTKMGKSACKILLNLISNPNSAGNIHSIIPTKFVEKGSVAVLK